MSKNTDKFKPKSSGYSPRKTKVRKTRKTFLIVCEGTKTEPEYFEGFRVSLRLPITVKPLRKNPDQIVNKAIQLKDEYDQVWCVFDRDNLTPQDFNGSIQKAKTQGLKAAYSNPCFELWYILHFEFLDTGKDTKYCEDRVKKLLVFNYNKEGLYDELINKQDIAIKHAKKLLSQYKHCNPVEDNPSTTVHLLVEELNKASSDN